MFEAERPVQGVRSDPVVGERSQQISLGPSLMRLVKRTALGEGNLCRFHGEQFTLSRSARRETRRLLTARGPAADSSARRVRICVRYRYEMWLRLAEDSQEISRRAAGCNIEVSTSGLSRLSC